MYSSHEKIFRKSARDQIYYTLKQDLLSLKLEPGKKISEKDIAEELGVSRTPVREAFLKLSEEGLLNIYPQKWTEVAKIDLDHVEEARFVRENLELATIRLACEHFPENALMQMEINLKTQQLCAEMNNYTKLFELDEEFHRTIFEFSNRKRTWNIIQQMNSNFVRIRMLRLAANSDWNIVISHHKEIFDSIKKKDLPKAVKVMKEHLNLVTLEKEELIRRYPEYFMGNLTVL